MKLPPKDLTRKRVTKQQQETSAFLGVSLIISMAHHANRPWDHFTIEHSPSHLGMGQNPGTPGEHQNSW